MAALGLPRYALLKSISNSKYVRKTNQTVDGSLRVSGEDASSLDCKFEFEIAKTRRNLLNIRSCYNNKYWVCEYDGGNFLKAGADVPNEDQSQWSCTLFEPILVDGKTIQLRSVYTKMLVALWYLPAPRDLTLKVNSNATGDVTRFTVEDWESLLILPKRVAFKGDNGMYLRTVDEDDHLWLKFDGGDIGDSSVPYQIFDGPDGTVRIKSEFSGKFWRRDPDWIFADSYDNSSADKNSLFMPVKAGGAPNELAFRCLGNNCFVKRLSVDGKDNCLNAAVSSITSTAKITAEEPVLSRNIYNVKFRLSDARIYDQSVITLVTKDVANYNTEPETQSLKLTYTQSTSSTFDRSVSIKAGVTSTISAGIPSIVEAQLQISVEVQASLSWSETKVTTSEIETDQVVTVPPMSRVKVSAIATQGKCDVPFSYSQRDVLATGETVVYEMDDGIYHGINSYNFQYETTNEPL